MKLYSLAGACSMVPRTALEWAKAGYQLELVDQATTKSKAYLQLNPQGQVPLLIEDNFVLTQNTTIVHYLDTLYPHAKIFGDGNLQQQALARQWLAYFNADVHPNFGPLFYPQNYVTSEQGIKALQHKVIHKIYQAFASVNDALDATFITGEQISIADVYLYVLLRWATAIQLDLSAYSKLDTHIRAVESNASVQTVLTQEKQEFLRADKIN